MKPKKEPLPEPEEEAVPGMEPFNAVCSSIRHGIANAKNIEEIKHAGSTLLEFRNECEADGLYKIPGTIMAVNLLFEKWYMKRIELSSSLEEHSALELNFAGPKGKLLQETLGPETFARITHYWREVGKKWIPEQEVVELV